MPAMAVYYGVGEFSEPPVKRLTQLELGAHNQKLYQTCLWLNFHLTVKNFAIDLNLRF
jgi:hypothetical protein